LEFSPGSAIILAAEEVIMMGGKLAKLVVLARIIPYEILQGEQGEFSPVHWGKGGDMIGCFMLLPLAGIFLAGTAVTGALVMAMGAVTSMITVVTGMLMGSLIAVSTGFMALWMFILSWGYGKVHVGCNEKEQGEFFPVC
jgi:hypothetical protein